MKYMLAVVLTLATVLAACGDDGNETSAVSGSGPVRVATSISPFAR